MPPWFGRLTLPRLLIPAAHTRTPKAPLTLLFAWLPPSVPSQLPNCLTLSAWHFSVHTFANQSGGKSSEWRDLTWMLEPPPRKNLLTSSSRPDTRASSTRRTGRKLGCHPAWRYAHRIQGLTSGCD